MGNALAPISTLPDPQEWGTIFEMAKALVPTGFLPKGIDKPEKAAAIMLKGRELGIPPMQALASIAIVNGKPTLAAELMLALIKRAYGREVIWIEESTADHATVGYLAGGKQRHYTFTLDMAKTASLLNNPTWRSYPDAMLRARAISSVARMEFPEVIAGMYVPGELGEDVIINDDGEVISASVSHIEVPRQQTQAMPPQPQTAAIPETLSDYSNDPAWQVANRRYRAVLADIGINEEGHKAWLKGNKVPSSKNVPADTLLNWAKRIEAKPQVAKDYIESHIAKKEAPKQEQPNTSGMTPLDEIIRQQQQMFDAPDDVDPEMMPTDEELGL